MTGIDKRGRNTATSPEGQRARPTAVKPPDASDPAYIQIVEQEFMTQWYRLAWKREPVAMEMVQHIQPEAIQDPFFREAYALLGVKVAKGEQIDDIPTSQEILAMARRHSAGFDKLEVLDTYFGSQSQTDEDLRRYGRLLITMYRGRAQLDIIRGAANLTQEAISNGGSVRKVADNLLDMLIGLHSRTSETSGPITQEDIANHLISKLDRESPAGYNWPWSKVQKSLGLMTPGKVVGLSGYSGHGKSLFTTNLAREWMIRGIPVIIFPTEMDFQWMERLVAEMARVPKAYAEEGDWRLATEEEKDKYREAAQSLVGLQWDIVSQPGISPQEIMARTRVLRRKYKGQQVIVIVDHMHRLDYPDGISADEALGASEATRQFKNMARSDRDGGLSWVLLYQPKKPEKEEDQYRPVFGNSIRGHGGGFNELDVHYSVWRRIVKVHHSEKTPWGTPLAVYDKVTDPMPAKGTFNSSDSKVDDEHVYLTADKHRIRGGNNYTIVLDIHEPSGYVYEQDWMHEVLRKPTTKG